MSNEHPWSVTIREATRLDVEFYGLPASPEEVAVVEAEGVVVGWLDEYGTWTQVDTLGPENGDEQFEKSVQDVLEALGDLVLDRIKKR